MPLSTRETRAARRRLVFLMLRRGRIDTDGLLAEARLLGLESLASGTGEDRAGAPAALSPAGLPPG